MSTKLFNCVSLPELRGLKISKLSNCTSAIKSWKILVFSGTWRHISVLQGIGILLGTKFLCNNNHKTDISEKCKHRKQTESP